VPFKLLDDEEAVVDVLTLECQKISGFSCGGVVRIDTIDSDGAGPFGLAVIALMAALHPVLGEAAVQNRLQLQDFRAGDIAEGLKSALKDEAGVESDKWLEEVRARDNIVEDSERLTTKMRLYQWLRER